MSSENGKRYGDLQTVVPKCCEKSLKFPKSNEFRDLIVQFMFSIHSLIKGGRVPCASITRSAAACSFGACCSGSFRTCLPSSFVAHGFASRAGRLGEK